MQLNLDINLLLLVGGFLLTIFANIVTIVISATRLQGRLTKMETIIEIVRPRIEHLDKLVNSELKSFERRMVEFELTLQKILHRSEQFRKDDQL